MGWQRPQRFHAIAASGRFEGRIVMGMILEACDHVFTRRRNYVERRKWDYLTRHLLHREPPATFLMPAEG